MRRTRDSPSILILSNKESEWRKILIHATEGGINGYTSIQTMKDQLIKRKWSCYDTAKGFLVCLVEWLVANAHYCSLISTEHLRELTVAPDPHYAPQLSRVLRSYGVPASHGDGSLRTCYLSDEVWVDAKPGSCFLPSTCQVL